MTEDELKHRLLSRAIDGENLDIAAFLHLVDNYGIDINAKSRKGEGLISILASKDEKAKILMLLKRGADINIISNNTGATALHKACVHNMPSMVKFLLEQGADCSAKTTIGRLTPLERVSMKSGRESIIEILKTHMALHEATSSEERISSVESVFGR